MTTAALIPFGEARKEYVECWLSSGLGNFYNSPEWLDTLHEGISSIRLYILRVGATSFVGYLPVAKVMSGKLVSLPLSPSVDLISSAALEDGERLDAFVASIAGMGRHYEIRSSLPKEELGGKFNCSNDYVDTVIEDLKSYQLRARSSKNVLRNIKKAEQNSVAVKPCEDFDVFREFVVRTRHRQGSPTYPAEFLDALHRNLVVPGHMRLLQSCDAGGEPVSIIALARGLRRTTYAIGANCEVPELMSTGANFLLFRDAIMEAQSSGVPEFGFGITPVSNHHLVRFKEQWGATSRPASILTGSSTVGGRNGVAVRFASQILKRSPRRLYIVASKLLFPVAL